jgi:hypothetical protein
VSASRPDELPDHLQEASFIPKPFEEAAILRSISGGHTSFAGRS